MKIKMQTNKKRRPSRKEKRIQNCGSFRPKRRPATEPARSALPHPFAFLHLKLPIWKQEMSSELAFLHQKRPMWKQEMDELRNRRLASKTADLKARYELRTRILASKMADLNFNPEPPNLVKSHFGVENGWSELKPGAPKSRKIEFWRREWPI